MRSGQGMPVHEAASWRAVPRGFQVAVVDAHDVDRDRSEAELIGAGIPLPVHHLRAWAASGCGPPSRLVIVRDADGRPRHGYGVEIRPSRVLPGHVTLQANRFQAGGGDTAPVVALGALVDLARRLPKVVRVDLSLLSRDALVMNQLRQSAIQVGFRPNPSAGGYVDTVVIDLAPSIDQIFASLHHTARRHIRATERKGTEVRPVSDPGLAPRLDALCRETMKRTRGVYRRLDWARLIQFGARHPHLARVVGVYRSGGDTPEAMLAFALGYHHGDHAEYAQAGSTRRDLRGAPVGYGAAWDLIRWAKQHGASWFDFGGVTAGSHDSRDDPLGGISDFKRYFSTITAPVACQLVYEPPGARARVANGVARALGRLLPRRSW